METAVAMPAPVADSISIVDRQKQLELVLDALKAAISAPGDHRLFRWGKLAGLFPSRLGASASAAKFALTEGLLEHVHTESRGRMIVEWVRATPKTMQFLDEHDSPKAVLRELQAMIGETRSGIPIWMTQARDEAAQLAMRFEHFAQELLRRLDSLDQRVDAAIRRAENPPPRLGEAMLKKVPWAKAILEHIDLSVTNHKVEQCELRDLFTTAKVVDPNLTLLDFHEGIRAMTNGGLLHLEPGTPDEMREPEYAVEIGGQMMWWAQR